MKKIEKKIMNYISPLLLTKGTYNSRLPGSRIILYLFYCF